MRCHSQPGQERLAHMTYQIPTAPCKPSAEIIPLSTANAREWWAVESRRVGTDWESLGRATARVMWRLGLTSSLAWVSS